MKKIIVVIVTVLLIILGLLIAYQKRNYIISEYNSDSLFCLTKYDCTWQSACSRCGSCSPINIFNKQKLNCQYKNTFEFNNIGCPAVMCNPYECIDNQCDNRGIYQ